MADYRKEFPDFDPASLPVIPAHWQDESWHNDACPFFVMGATMGVFVDYVDPAMRECGADVPRFSVVRLEDGAHPLQPSTIIATDDWCAVLAEDYKARIGYDPFADDPNNTEAEIAEILAEHAAHEIAAHWVARLGLGFHPDTRGADYSPALSADDVQRYDRDMETLMRAPGDPYAIGLEAMADAGLIEGDK